MPHVVTPSTIDEVVKLLETLGGVPLLGITYSPTATRRVKGGFIKASVIYDLAKQAGLPESFHGGSRKPEDGARSGSDAARRAWSHIERAKWFRQHYMRRQLKAKAGETTRGVRWERDVIIDCVLTETRKKLSEQEIDAGTIQSVVFVPEEPATAISPGSKPKFILNPVEGPVTKELVKFYHLFKESFAGDDINAMIVAGLKEHGQGVLVRKGGGLYFVPRLTDTPPFNDGMAKILKFSELVTQTGEIVIDWFREAHFDCEEVKKMFAKPVQAAVKQDSDKIGGSILRLIDEMKKGSRVEKGTIPRQLEALVELKKKGQLYRDVLKVQLGGLDTEIDTLTRHCQLLLNGKQPHFSEVADLRRRMEKPDEDDGEEYSEVG